MVPAVCTQPRYPLKSLGLQYEAWALPQWSFNSRFSIFHFWFGNTISSDLFGTVPNDLGMAGGCLCVPVMVVVEWGRPLVVSILFCRSLSRVKTLKEAFLGGSSSLHQRSLTRSFSLEPLPKAFSVELSAAWCPFCHLWYALRSVNGHNQQI